MSDARPVPVSESSPATVKSHSRPLTDEDSNGPSTFWPRGSMHMLTQSLLSLNRLKLSAFALSLALVAVTAANLVPTAAGQSQPGVPWNTIPLPIPNGFVDVLSGKIYIEIPLGSMPQRNHDTISSRMVYDSSQLNLTFNGPWNPIFNNGGWRPIIGNGHSGTGNISGTTNNCTDSGYPDGNVTTYNQFSFTDYRGTVHSVANQNVYTKQINCSTGPPSNIPDPANPGYPSSTTGIASDGSGYTFNVINFNQMQVFANDGTLVYDNYSKYFPDYPLDTNGNIGAKGSQPDSYSNLPSGTSCTSTGTTTQTVTASDGSSASYTFTCTSLSVSEVVNGITYTSTGVFLSSLGLPDNTEYSFTYDTGSTGMHMGNLLSVTLPSGGAISFTHVPGPVIGGSGEGAFGGCVNSVTFFGGIWTLSYSYNSSTRQTTTTVLSPQRYDSASKSNLSDMTVFTSVPNYLYLSSAQYYSGSSKLLKTVSYSYDPYFLPLTITTQLNDSGQSSQVTYQYLSEMRDHVTQKQEVDFTGAVIRTTVTAYNGPFLKPSSVNVYAGSNTGATPVSSTLYTYDEYTASYCKNGVPMMASFNGAYGHDDTDFGTGITRGNVTTIQRLISGTTYATTHNCYDTLGNVTQTVDANGNPTSYSYTENWADTDCFPSGTITHAFPTTITDALGHSTKASYFTCTILRQSIADQNQINAGLTSTYTYDKLERPLTITYPDGGITTDCYSQNPGSSCYTSTLPPFTTESRLITGTSYLTTKTLLDSYNRVGETQLTSDPDCTSNDKTDTTYDAFGRVLSVSNPYCTTSDPTYGVTTSAYDALARVTAVTAQDGSVTATSYSGNTTTITDPAGVSRKYVVDALDRVTQIFENPISLNYETDYAYDALNDLLTVTQKGGSTTSTNWRTRTFIYDGLSRLTQASNPESGTAAYSYDANGNLVTKTSPAQNQTGTATVTLTYCYDALNRLSGKAYTAQSCPLSSPVASYTYDQTSSNGLTVTNGIGRRTGMTDPIGSEAWSYDSMGRPLADLRYYSAIRRGCSSYTRTTSYSYNLDGSVKTLTYPSGPTYTYAYSSAARPISVSDQLGVSYANRAAYSPSGAVSSLTNVSGLVSSFYYNSRLQPCRISATSSGAAPSSCANMANIGNVVDYTYNFSLGTADNGNVTSITNNRDNTRSQNFTYDALNRLATAQTQTTGVTIPNSNCWGFTFGYDAWGNLLSGMTTGPAGCSEPMPLNVSATTSNQVVGYCYDSAGNLLDQGSCPTSGSHTYSYNAENQMTGLSGSVYYKYDGDGKRVYKAPGGDILYWYGVGSGALDEMYSCTGTSAGEYVFFAGKRIAFLDSSGNTDYYFADHLGSSRVVTNSSGSILDDSDFYPFGGERPITSSSGNSYKFTGKERDAESGLDNFGARYNSSNLGRFMSPDPEGILSARTTSPQSWNFYSYVQNNPVNAVDPEGLDCVYIGDNSASVKRGDCVSDTDNGIFVNGTIDTTSGTYNSSTGTLGFNYTNDDTGAIGSGVIGNVYPSGGVSDQDRLNALGLAGQIAAPGVNLAANGLRAFGYVVAAPLMVAAECGAGADSCTKGNVAMALVPELGPILEGANLLKISKVIQYERVGGFAQATKDFEALQGAERTIGNVKVKDLADGSKAVLRNFSSEGRPTLEIQNQVGKDIKIRYN